MIFTDEHEVIGNQSPGDSMVSDRLTTSMDEQSRKALDDLVNRTGKDQSELVRRALVFYAANFQATNTDMSGSLEEYHKMLTSGEHVLLDIDFLHCLLDHAVNDIEDPDPDLVKALKRVSRFHESEYTDRFNDIGDLLNWLSVCGFLTVREIDKNTYQVVFPTREIRWFMTLFIKQSTASHPFELEFDEGISKLIIKQQPIES